MHSIAVVEQETFASAQFRFAKVNPSVPSVRGRGHNRDQWGDGPSLNIGLDDVEPNVDSLSSPSAVESPAFRLRLMARPLTARSHTMRTFMGLVRRDDKP
jgi:hypothetical protein